MIATATPTSKQCTGAKLAGEVLTPSHEALLSEFNRYAASPDGLDRICRVCWSTYEKTRRARKAAEAAGDAALADKAIELSNAAAERQRAMPTRTYRATTDEHGKIVALTPVAEPPAVLRAATPGRPLYRDELAKQAHRGKLAGYGSELIGGVIYALPEAPEAVGTPEGQAALAACNEARGAERRRLDRERKREQRARAKAAAAEA